MTCTAYDPEKDYCKELDMKFYKGMQKPCENISDPSMCPIVFQRTGGV